MERPGFPPIPLCSLLRSAKDRGSGCSLISRTLIILAILIWPALSPFPCPASPPRPTELVVGGDHNFPPYEFLDSKGEPAGFNIDLIRALARRMDFRLTFRLGPWSRVRKELVTGKIDLLAGMFFSKERDRFVDFSTPHTVLRHALFTRKGSPEIRSLEDLRGKEILVQRDDIMHDFIRERVPKENLFLVDSPLDALRVLSSGKHDCALVAELQGLYLAKAYGLNNLTARDLGFPSRKYCFAVTQGRDILLGQINEGLAILKETGVYQEIYDKWFGVLERKERTRRQLFWIAGLALVPILLILGFVFLWSWMLKKQVAKKTLELREEVERHRQTAQDLRETQERFRLALEATKDGLWEIRYRDGSHFFSDNMFTMLGYDPKDQKKSLDFFISIFHPEDLPAVRQAFHKLLHDRGRDDYAVEFRLRARDGAWHNILSRGRCVDRGEDGKALRIIGTHTDITDLRRTEQALGLERENFRLLVEESPLGISLIDGKGTYLYVNPKFVEIFGYDLNDFHTGREWFRTAFPDPETRRRVISAWTKDNEGSRPGNAVSRIYTVTCKDGKEREVHFRTVQLKNNQYLILYEDITETRRLERQLQQAQKMEAVGTLAGGIAHDFNNILSVIIGHADLILTDLDPRLPFYDNILEIRKAGERAASLTRRLLTFSRKQVVEPRILDLNQVIDGTKKMLERLIGEDIILKTRLETSLFPVFMDPGQVEQILLNLASNARDAMPEGGTLTIETANRVLDPAFFADRGVKGTPGPYVMIRVSDTGLGMDEATRERIFEPFFTTKGMGKGTGLGLATVYGIVKQSRGFIWAESLPGEGTFFEIFIPRTESEGDSAPRESQSRKPESGGTETIMVVEDDKDLRNLAARILESRGYTVILSRDASSALQVVREYQGPIHLLITDVVMPGMSGVELARRFRPLRPGARILFMSGYAGNNIERYGPLADGDNLIMKPFTPQEFVRKVREVLAGERRPEPP